MNTFATALESVRIGAPQVFRNMTVFPLLAADPRPADYFTLDQAIAAVGGFHITEVDEAGSVNTLKVSNTLERPVLLLDGEEVVGAKQNRVFNLSILAPAQAELLVPVSCVEAGRWRHESAEFKPAPRAQYSAARGERLEQVSAAMLRAEGPRSDQQEVWASLARKGRRLGIQSQTGAMADLYDRSAETVDEYVSAFSPAEGQVGAAVSLNGDLVGLDLFDSPFTLAKLLPKLLRSYALDAIEPAPDAEQPSDPAPLLEALAKGVESEFDAVGLGVDVRLEAPGFRGAALKWDEKVVHLCAFRVSQPSGMQSGGIMRASRRGSGPTSSG